jgi:hypothetical protein
LAINAVNALSAVDLAYAPELVRPELPVRNRLSVRGPSRFVVVHDSPFLCLESVWLSMPI